MSAWTTKQPVFSLCSHPCRPHPALVSVSHVSLLLLHLSSAVSPSCLLALSVPFLVLLCPQEEMTSALATMRVDYEQIKIKKIEDASNPLLLKRRKKARALEAAALAH